jgi:hypothetical protein
MIRDAFRQQGPFLGSGGRYSPGPTTAAPLLAMLRPLSNDLSLPWASFRSSPAFAGAATSPYVRLLVGPYGSEDAKTAETTVDARS